MKYNLFLFDLDDTLLNFRESEKLSLFLTLKSMGHEKDFDDLLRVYQIENNLLWKDFESGLTTKDVLKVERFRRTFDRLELELNPETASARYLEALPETVVLMDYAVEICEWLSQQGEIGIITNGIHAVQTQRIKNSKIAPYISFVGVSEGCGFAKPDVRFFDYCTKMAKTFEKASTIIIGDRLEADILGAHNFGIDSCWFNPHEVKCSDHLTPKYVIKHLSELHHLT
jgi:2-haloacid dehalogenase